MICTMLPSKLGWLEVALSNQLGVGVLQIECEPWLKARGISPDGKAIAEQFGARWLGLLGLMLNSYHALAAEKKS
jgi:hypothetical protein